MKLCLFLSWMMLDTLPSQEVLFQSIDSFYYVQAQAELLEFQTSKKGEWLKYLPTVGVTYTLDGKPRPAISFSSTILYRAKKDRQQQLVKQQSIREKFSLKAEKAKAEVRKLFLEYQLLQEEIAIKKEALEIDQQLFEIQQARYKRLEIGPEAFLKAKKAWLIQQQTIRELEQEGHLLKREILWVNFLN